MVSTHTCSHYLHTVGWNSWTQRHAASLVCLLDQCVTACSLEKHTPNEYSQNSRSTGDCWGGTLKPSNVTTARQQATCKNIGQARGDPTNNADLGYSCSKYWCFNLPFTNLIVGHERNKSIMQKMKDMSLMCESCGYFSGCERNFFTFNSSLEGCYGYIILLKSTVSYLTICSRDNDWGRVWIHVNASHLPSIKWSQRLTRRLFFNNK